MKKTIEAYCASNGINVPPGFSRHSASRYAIVRRDISPPKLIAVTWFKQEDLIYHIENSLAEEIECFSDAIEIFDFKAGTRLIYSGSNRLTSGEPIR